MVFKRLRFILRGFSHLVSDSRDNAMIKIKNPSDKINAHLAYKECRIDKIHDDFQWVNIPKLRPYFFIR